MAALNGSVTELLRDWAKGNPAALEALTPLVYSELRRLADAYMRRERTGHTLEPTALIHEAYLRLVEQKQPEWESRSQFYRFAAHLIADFGGPRPRAEGAKAGPRRAGSS